MALSDEPLDSENVKDYEKLCNLTKEGMFVNIVDKGKKADICWYGYRVLC